MSKHRLHNVIENIKLTDSSFILRFERKDIQFKTGQHIGIGPEDGIHLREYSVYSSQYDDYIEILVKEVLDGEVSPILGKLQKGDKVTVDEPVGDFLLKDEGKGKNNVFIASGTGIAPFHSFVKTYKDLDYKLIHGVRYAKEAYGKSDFNPGNYVLCTSQDDLGDFKGRVTDYIREFPFDKNAEYYLCGNSNMIHEVYEILDEQGVSFDNIHAEVYF